MELLSPNCLHFYAPAFEMNIAWDRPKIQCKESKIKGKLKVIIMNHRVVHNSKKLESAFGCIPNVLMLPLTLILY